MADDDSVCDFCGKDVEPAPEVRVREGEKRFHLACFLAHKRQEPPQPPKSN